MPLHRAVFPDSGGTTASPMATLLEPVSRDLDGPAGSMVDVRQLRKKFGDLTAVDGISFQVEPGEVFGILGPNGAGKTTTLEIVETLQRPTSGEVYVAGFDALRQADQV